MREIGVFRLIRDNKELKFLLLFFLVITLQFNASACDCDNPPNTFITSLGEFTAQLEVVEVDTLSKEGIYEYWPLVLTKLKVIRLFNDSKVVEYIWMNNSSGSGCERGLFPDYIGQKYIITGRIIEDKRYDKWIADSSKRNFLSISTCGKMVLDIDGNNVFGVITKNNNKKIKEKYDQLMQQDESKAKAYYKEVYQSKHHKDLVQKMSINQFYRLMKQ